MIGAATDRFPPVVLLLVGEALGRHLPEAGVDVLGGSPGSGEESRDLVARAAGEQDLAQRRRVGGEIRADRNGGTEVLSRPERAPMQTGRPSHAAT